MDSNRHDLHVPEHLFLQYYWECKAWNYWEHRLETNLGLLRYHGYNLLLDPFFLLFLGYPVDFQASDDIIPNAAWYNWLHLHRVLLLIHRCNYLHHSCSHIWSWKMGQERILMWQRQRERCLKPYWQSMSMLTLIRSLRLVSQFSWWHIFSFRTFSFWTTWSPSSQLYIPTWLK